MKLELVLPGCPYVKKGTQKFVMRGRRPVLVNSPQFDSWFASQMLRRRIYHNAFRGCGLPLTCEVSVSLHVYLPQEQGGQGGDLIGYMEAVADLLQAEKWSKPRPDKASRMLRNGLGIIADDRQIVNWDDSWPFVDRVNPRCEITITTIGEVQASL